MSMPPPRDDEDNGNGTRDTGGSGAGCLMGGAGVVAFAVLNVLIGFAALSTSEEAAILFGALMLGAAAFGGGGLMIAVGRRQLKAFGIGLMIGWALLSVISAGYCTGLNPEMYGAH